VPWIGKRPSPGDVIRLLEEVRYETGLIINHQGPILPDGHSATGIVNHPRPDIGVVAVEVAEAGKRLVDEAAVGVGAGRLRESLAVFDNADIGSLAPAGALAKRERSSPFSDGHVRHHKVTMPIFCRNGGCGAAPDQLAVTEHEQQTS
jgi:hypothetical protein